MKKKITELETAQKLANIMSEHLSGMSLQEQKRRIKAGQEILKAKNPKAPPICYSDTHAKPASNCGTSRSSVTVREQ
jgi:hypothetical protein